MSRDAVLAVMLWGLWPLWLAAGVADWACHRRTGIERSSGIGEWGYHALQAAQVGAALLIALLLEITTTVAVLLAVLVLWHWYTAYADTRYTHGRREILPFEQTVHAVMELLPVFAVVLLALRHPEAWSAPEWAVAWKEPPVPLVQSLAFLAVTLAVQLTPLMEEGLRCRRGKAGLTSSPPAGGSRR